MDVDEPNVQKSVLIEKLENQNDAVLVLDLEELEIPKEFDFFETRRYHHFDVEDIAELENAFESFVHLSFDQPKNELEMVETKQ